MSGIKDLDILLSNMEPVLDKRDFVFCSFPTFDWDKMRELNPVGFFQEKEGMTFILDLKDAIGKDTALLLWSRHGSPPSRSRLPVLP